MTSSTQLKGLLVGFAAVALIGTAMAQGNPPNPAVKSAPVGAGQRSSQGTPMGDTGTPTGGSAATGSTSTNMGSTNMGSTNNSTNMGSTSNSGTSMGSSSSSADTSMAPMGRTAKRTKRMARADRN